jgi:hypothetical protein
MKVFYIAALGMHLSAGLSLLAQPQNHYTGVNVTGQLVLTATVNVLQQAQQVSTASRVLTKPVAEVRPKIPPKLLPPLPRLRSSAQTVPGASNVRSLAVQSLSSNSGFPGITHLDQRNANNGNQFSVEPPNQAVAVGNGFVVEGVNNAFQVYSTSGSPLLPRALSSNQVFGVSPAIDRSTGVNGVFPTDMRVFYDQSINRWFVVQRAQANDTAGNPLPQSQEYIAVSQTGDPTGTYNVYTIDTTNTLTSGCPCLSDYPQIGADQYGFYVSSNEYNWTAAFNSQLPIDSTILAISKASLASGISTPTSYKFALPSFTGYEFSIQPAGTPPGASYALGAGGVEFFVSSLATGDTNLSLWAMSNTSSLATANPSPVLTQTIVPTLLYSPPPNANQRPGPLPYGSSLTPQGLLALLDGSDSRILSLSYSGGRLYATLGTLVTDASGHFLAGGAYVILSPTFRGGVLAASVQRNGYLLVQNNHLLRPAIGVNPQGKGAVVFTIVGSDYYPSAAFLPIDTFSTASTVQIAAAGQLPEDGFTGYPNLGFPDQGTARWGDYSTAVAASDGSIWMVTQYIPNAPRTQFANWGTFLIRYAP